MNLFYKAMYWLFMSAVVVLGLLLIVSFLPFKHAVTVKVVKSGSMEPAIQTGSIVVGQARDSYDVGDVITFGADTKTQIPTTHRIVAIEGEGSGMHFTTKGDANDAPDPSTTSIRDVHSKVLFSVPYMGYVLDFAKQPVGFALLVGLPAALIILEEIGKIVREISRMQRRKKASQYNETHVPPQKTKIQ